MRRTVNALNELFANMEPVLQQMTQTTEITNQTSSTVGGATIKYEPHNEYNFYGGTPSKEEIAGAEKINQEEFGAMLEKYYKDKGRVSL